MFEEKSFGTAILLLMVLPATPLPTGGVTHVFEAITIVLGVETPPGRRTIWIPERWRHPELGATATDRAIPLIIRWVRRVERISHPRGMWLLEQGWMLRLLGVLFAALAAAAAVALPFSGLDTLPSLGAVSIALAIILEDIALIGVGIFLGNDRRGSDRNDRSHDRACAVRPDLSERARGWHGTLPLSAHAERSRAHHEQADPVSSAAHRADRRVDGSLRLRGALGGHAPRPRSTAPAARRPR